MDWDFNKHSFGKMWTEKMLRKRILHICYDLHLDLVQGLCRSLPMSTLLLKYESDRSKGRENMLPTWILHKDLIWPWPLTKKLGSRPLHIHLPQIVSWKLIILLYLVGYFKVLYFFLQCGYPHCFDRILLVLKINNCERVYSKVHHIEIFCFMDSDL